MNEISDEIITLLKRELPPTYQGKIEEFDRLNKSAQYRAAFMVLYEFKKIEGWIPSNTLLACYEKYWWQYAN